MKAVQINKYGGPEILEIKDIPRPTPQKEQVLVTVKASGLNPFESKLRSGMFQNFIPLQLPITMGGDFSGVVTSLGEGVTNFHLGDEAYGTAMVLSKGSGSFSEYAVVNTTRIAKKPKNTSFVQAAGLPMAGNSAVQTLEEKMKLSQGQKILIHGGVGGIGHIAIQLAKSIGAYVTTTVSGKDTRFVKSLGADEVIDYKTQDFEKIVKDYDAVYDTVGGRVTTKSFKVLRRGGILVSMLGTPDTDMAKRYGVTAFGLNTSVDTVHLQHLAQLVEKGIIKVHIDRIFPLAEVTAAFTHLETGHPRGKVVLTVN